MNGEHKSKLGPIPDEHFEKDVAPPGTYHGKRTKEQEAEFDAETARIKASLKKKSGAPRR